MPKAIVSVLTERFDLTTLPAVDGEEGGWVELRRLSYGEKLAKDSEAMKMRFALQGDRKGNTSVDAEMSVINEIVTLLEFKKCIVKHNLQNEDGRLLDFSKEADVRALDPRVGDEISSLIGEMNDFEKASTESLKDASGK